MIFTLNIFVDHDLKFGGEEVVEETEEKNMNITRTINLENLY